MIITITKLVLDHIFGTWQLVVCDMTQCNLVRKHKCIWACCLHLQYRKCFAQALVPIVFHHVTYHKTVIYTSNAVRSSTSFFIPSTPVSSEFSIFVKLSSQIFRLPPPAPHYVLYVLPIIIKSFRQHWMRNTRTVLIKKALCQIHI